MHEYRAGSLLLAKALNEQSGLPVKAEVISGWPEDPSVLKGAAAIVIYDSATKVIGRHMEEVDALAKAGTGLMFMHYAVHPSAKDGEKFFRPWTGGAFESDFSVNPFWVAELQPLPNHPVSSGITAPVKAHDEFYYNIRFRQDRSTVLNLATATPTRENMVRVNNLWTQEGYDGLGKPQTLMWGTQRDDGGRGVGFSGGHFHRNWAIDDYRKLVLNAIVWCSGVNVPKDGVTSLPLTEGDLNASLDEKGSEKPRLTLPTPEELAAIKMGKVPTLEEHAASVKQTKFNKEPAEPGAAPDPKKKGKKPKQPEPDSPLRTEAKDEPAPAVAPGIDDAVQTQPKRKNRNKETTTPPVATDKKASSASDMAKRDAEWVPASALQVPDDLEVTVWATSPMLFNPTNMDTDREGRIWVAEGVNYRKKNTTRRPEGDRIMVLEDTDHDGKADKSHVFVQDPELVSPLGIAVFGNKIVVSQPPHLIVYTDVDGDLHFDPKIDKRENLLSGFMGFNHDHSLHAVVAGPDGRWYFNHGNTGADFTTRDGVRYRVGGPYGEAQKLSGAKSDDGRIWTGGFAASMNPDGTALRMIGHGFRNSYEHCVTSLGDVYQSDNDDPPACRNTWLMEGGFLGFFSRSGMHTWEADRRRGQSVPVAEWRQEDPGTLPPGDVYGRGSPTGVAFYENGALPAKYQGMFLSCDARVQVIYGYHPVADGAGKKLERFEFLKATEGTQFRPSDVMVGADGAIYVADWFDGHVGGHGTQDDSLSGAIYRIAPKGFRPEIKKDHASDAERAAALLMSPAPNVRFEGFEALRAIALKAPAVAKPLLSRLLDHSNPLLRARAVWLLPYLGTSGIDQVKALLEHKEPDQRILALRVLRNVGFDFKANAAVLDKLVRDESPAVRREAAVALRDMAGDFKQPLVMELLTRYDGKDRTYLEACGLAAEGIEAQTWKALHQRLSQTDPLTWTAAFARITWRLQPQAAIGDLVKRATTKQLIVDDRKLAVDTIAFTRCKAAMDAMVQLRKAEPVIAEMATAWLLIRAFDEWDEFGSRQVLKEEALYDPEKVEIQELKMPEPTAKSALPAVKEIMQLKGDPAKGQIVSMRCTVCHRIGDEGVEYGPDLAGWVANQGLESFLKAVIHPSETIALGFEGQTVPLKDGRQVQGILISAGDPVTVRSIAGVTQMIPRSLINKRTAPMKRSLMLGADELGLTAQDLADLAEYLKDYK